MISIFYDFHVIFFIFFQIHSNPIALLFRFVYFVIKCGLNDRLFRRLFNYRIKIII